MLFILVPYAAMNKVQAGLVSCQGTFLKKSYKSNTKFLFKPSISLELGD